MPDESGSALKRDFGQEVTHNIIRMFEQGTAPWQKPGKQASFEMPSNPTTDKPYRGGNAINLMSLAAIKGYEDQRWLTYKQAAEQGWQIRKDEKGTQIEYWEFPDPAKTGKHDQNDRAFYNRRTDRVHLPPQAGFKTA